MIEQVGRREHMDPMSIASMSTSMAQSQTMSQIGMAVMNMAMDDFTATGANTAAMIEAMPAPAMEASVNPAVGGNIDMSI